MVCNCWSGLDKLFHPFIPDVSLLEFIKRKRNQIKLTYFYLSVSVSAALWVQVAAETQKKKSVPHEVVPKYPKLPSFDASSIFGSKRLDTDLEQLESIQEENLEKKMLNKMLQSQKLIGEIVLDKFYRNRNRIYSNNKFSLTIVLPLG